MKKIIFFLFICLFVASVSFASAPPGVRTYIDVPQGSRGSTTDTESKTSISAEFGYYIPSFKTLNNDITAGNQTTIPGGAVLNGKISFHDQIGYFYFGGGYWSSSSKTTSTSTSGSSAIDDITTISTVITREISLIPIFLGYAVSIPIPIATEEIKLNIGLQGGFDVATYSITASSTTSSTTSTTSSTVSYDALGFGYDAGIKTGAEYFLIPEILSAGANFGYIFFGKIPSLQVQNSTVSGINKYATLKARDGSNRVLELNGFSFGASINLYF